MEVVDAMQLAAREAALQRDFRLIEMPRLREMAGDSGSDRTAHLTARFHRLSEQVGIEGRVVAKLRTKCQRCLRPVDVEVEDEFHVAVVGAEAELDRLAATQDAIVADASRLDLEWLTEEQLLLAAPLVPLHRPGECEEFEGAKANAAPSDATASQRPFANLRDLLDRKQ